MIKVGISRIGIEEQNEVDDTWTTSQQEEDERGGVPTPLASIHYFKDIDQTQSDITEKLTIDESGRVFDTDLSFVVRTQRDIDLGKKYINRPLVIHVWTVDGSHYKIGTKSYPAYLESDNRYENTSTREMAFTVHYQSVTGILK